MAKIGIGNNVGAVMVSSESDLSSMTQYPPGTIAFTAGFKRIWQLSIEGQWVDVLESDTAESEESE